MPSAAMGHLLLCTARCTWCMVYTFGSPICSSTFVFQWQPVRITSKARALRAQFSPRLQSDSWACVRAATTRAQLSVSGVSW